MTRSSPDHQAPSKRPLRKRISPVTLAGTRRGEGYTAWVTVPIEGAGETWSVSATQGRSRGECGIYANDGLTQLAVTIDRDAGSGTLAWFGKVGNTHNETFPVPPGLIGELTLVDDQGVIAVLVGGRRLATVTDPTLRAPSRAGVATHGDTASCDFDDVTVTTAP